MDGVSEIALEGLSPGAAEDDYVSGVRGVLWRGRRRMPSWRAGVLGMHAAWAPLEAPLQRLCGPFRFLLVYCDDPSARSHFVLNQRTMAYAAGVAAAMHRMH